MLPPANEVDLAVLMSDQNKRFADKLSWKSVVLPPGVGGLFSGSFSACLKLAVPHRVASGFTANMLIVPAPALTAYRTGWPRPDPACVVDAWCNRVHCDYCCNH